SRRIFIKIPLRSPSVGLVVLARTLPFPWRRADQPPEPQHAQPFESARQEPFASDGMIPDPWRIAPRPAPSLLWPGHGTRREGESPRASGETIMRSHYRRNRRSFSLETLEGRVALSGLAGLDDGAHHHRGDHGAEVQMARRAPDDPPGHNAHD